MAKHGQQYEMGQYMTPSSVADELCGLIKRPISEWVVFDPACGEGALLIAAIKKMKECGLKNIIDKIYGMDLDPEMVNRSRRNIAQELAADPSDTNIHCGDYLGELNTPLYSEQWRGALSPNIILANPPYAKNREYLFFDQCNHLAKLGTEILFIVPLAFMDRLQNSEVIPVYGRPFGVTTGHCFVRHIAGKPYSYKSIKCDGSNSSHFTVYVGAKLYEVGAGVPPQTKELLESKPYSSEVEVPGWYPCYRTGDIQQFLLLPPRSWVLWGEHLAHPKTLELFSGPRLFIRRVPIWKNRQIGAVFVDEIGVCAGDVLVVKHDQNDIELLKGLCVLLNSEVSAAKLIVERPSLEHRMSFPKFSSKDINKLIDGFENKFDLRDLAKNYLSAKKDPQ